MSNFFFIKKFPEWPRTIDVAGGIQGLQSSCLTWARRALVLDPLGKIAFGDESHSLLSTSHTHVKVTNRKRGPSFVLCQKERGEKPAHVLCVDNVGVCLCE